MVATRLFHFACLAALVFLAACGDAGTSATGEPASQAQGKTPSPIAFSGQLEFPRDAYVSPELIQQRRGSEVTTFTLTGDEAWKKNPDSAVDPELKVLNMVTSNNMAWGIYQIPDLLSADDPTLATVDFFAGSIPDIAWIGVADYSQQRWVFTEVTTPTTSNNFSLDPNLNVVSPGGNAYVAIVIAGEDTAQLSQVQLRLDLHAVPPTNLSASTDDSMYIWVSWEPVLDEGVEGYLVERAFSLEDPWTTIETYPFPEQPFHLDIHGGENQLPEGTNVYYRVRSYIGSAVGPPSLVAAGMRPHRLPSPDIQATPESGYAPLTVELDASRSVDPGGGEITKFEWDWTNDGTYDLDSGTDPVVTPPAYTVTGVNETRLRVTDDEGMTNWVTVEITVIVDPPLADLSSDLTSGPSPLVVSFDASASTDPDGGAIANYQWDWEGDGTYDFDSGPDGAIQHQFEAVREYNTTVLVTDDDGQTATAMLKITAKDPYGTWYHTLGKGSGNDFFNTSVEDNSGNLIAVGDDWIGKFDPTGELLWLKDASLPFDYIAVDSGDNIYVAARNGSPVVKLNSDGSALWAKSYAPAVAGTILHGVSMKGDNLVLFTKHEEDFPEFLAFGVVELSSTGSVVSRKHWEDFSPGSLLLMEEGGMLCSGSVQTGPVNFDAVLLRLDEAGDPIWGRSFVLAGLSNAIGTLSLCDDGNICAIGYTSFPALSTVVQKWGMDGVLLWSRTCSLSTGEQQFQIRGLALPGGGIVTTAYTQRSLGQDFNGMLALWDDDGNNIFIREWFNAGEQHETFRGLALTENGQLLITGSARYVVAGDPALPTWSWQDVSDAEITQDEVVPEEFAPTEIDVNIQAQNLSVSFSDVLNPMFDVGDFMYDSNEALMIRLDLNSIQ